MDDIIEELIDLDDRIFEVDQKLAPYIQGLIKDDKIHYTPILFFIYITSTNFLKNSIFNCSASKDVYSISVLYRSLLEHFLRFQFIFAEYILSREDKVSEEYYNILKLSEHIDLIKSLQVTRSLSGSEKINIEDRWQMLIDEFPKYNNYKRKDIEEEVKKFSTKNIIRFLVKHIEKSEESGFMKNSIIEYSEMSSFVHGGIYAHSKMLDYSDISRRHSEVIRLVRLSLHIATSIKVFSLFIFSKHDEKIISIYNEMNTLMNMIDQIGNCR